jgi:signal transduction histidine kinase/DNA-binding NarL/FixJ family response regulator
MKFLLRFLIIGAIALSLTLALLNFSFKLIAVVNLVSLVLALIDQKIKPQLDQGLSKIAVGLGIEYRFQSSEILLKNLVHEVERKNQAFSINIIEDKIFNKEQLSKTLERIVNLTYKIFEAESVELALFNRTTNLYHSSIVIGTPFHTSSQAMLSGAAGSEMETRPDVLVQTLSFAGTMLGTLRVGLKKGTVPRVIDQEIAKLMGVQASLALINAQYTSELMKMKVSSEETLKAKTGFLANLSHEIRAPLGIMLNAVELVIDGLCGAINKDQADTLGMVHRNGEHLLELINDVLDYAKVESGRLQANKSDIIVNELLEDVCNVVRSQADNKSHKLICRAVTEAFAISCDRRHARQMMINLLTNAIKYTPDGGQIEVWAERSAQGKVKIHVKDSGVGIDDSERDKVFAPFERLENSYSLNQVGAGLGMSLTKRLAEVNGGSIDFSSKNKEGSDFWLIFPTIDLSTVVSEAPAQTIEAAQGKGEAILLVEQDEGERSVVSKYLTHQGYDVHAVAGKQDALAIIKAKKLDIAIVDNKAADESSEDVIKAIRNSSQSPSLPVILVSSKGFVFDIERYLKSGIDRCLIKPLKMAELTHICRQLLDGTFNGDVIDETDKTLIEAGNHNTKEVQGPLKTSIIKLENIRRIL